MNCIQMFLMLKVIGFESSARISNQCLLVAVSGRSHYGNLGPMDSCFALRSGTL